eukprot:GFUD01013568.1.p1 GENE.GFUD01013568.1~~GFUD01013568.1.p1  ORF type:complete len:223 (+),score=52.64 GFUD01013568.1:208-876(+)
MKTFRLFAFFFCACSAQLKFGGSSGSSDSSGSSESLNTDTKQKLPDTRFFTGNEALDGGILGVGAGLLGGAVLGGVLGGVLNGGGNTNGCGRRRRQADEPNTKFLGALLGGGSGGCNCGRKRRQAPGEDQPGTKFFGLENILGGGSNNCCNCPPTQSNRCQCSNLTFQDQNGNTNGACRRADETGRLWCYTTGGFGCSDARQSQRFPNNPWSYQACNSYGRK